VSSSVCGSCSSLGTAATAQKSEQFGNNFHHTAECVLGVCVLSATYVKKDGVRALSEELNTTNAPLLSLVPQ
jgi:hypothetical protein